jgi:hypothetical protein
MPLTLKNFNSTWWGWWQPWANTIGYWKFDWDLTDEMWLYSGTASNITCTYESLPWDNNIKCLVYSRNNWWYISTANQLRPSFWKTQNDFSLWVWMNFTTFASSRDALVYIQSANNSVLTIQYAKSDLWYSNALLVQLYNGSSDNVRWANVSIQTGTWYNLFYTYNATTRLIKFYLNWAYVGSWTFPSDYTTSNNGQYSWLLQWPSAAWKASNMIFEKQEWLAQEVSDYFNQTKSLYWIS